MSVCSDSMFSFSVPVHIMACIQFSDRLCSMLDPETADEFLEISPLCGMAMEYGDIPRAGVIGGKQITRNTSHFPR